MNWYKQAEQKDFDFYSEQREIWRAMCRQEQKDVGISFDMENDDSIGPIRRIKLKTKHKAMTDIRDGTLAVFAELWQAGGDWECPVYYFRCQIKEESHWGPKFIYIPKKNEGNVNLTSSKEKGKFTACDNNDTDCADIKKKDLWDAFKKHVEKRANEFYNKNKGVDEAKEFGMYDRDKSLSLAKSNKMSKEAQQHWSLTPDPFRDEGLYKFVKVNGQYRFIPNGTTHKLIVGEGEVAEAAGTIAEYSDTWRLYFSYSTSLGGVGTGDNEVKELEQIIGKPYKGRY
jgi:hypothetical protein